MTDRPTLTLRHPEPEVAAAQAGAVASIAAEVSVTTPTPRWVIYRRVPRGYARAGSGRLPRFHHETMEGALAEAKRLALLHPESTFVLMQEQATVQAGAAA